MEATHIKVKTCRIISWMFLRTKKWCSVKWAAYCLFRGVTVLKSQCVWVTWHNKLEWRHLPNIVQFPFVQPKWLTFWGMNTRSLVVFCVDNALIPLVLWAGLLEPEWIRLVPAMCDRLIGLESGVFGGLVDSVSGSLSCSWEVFTAYRKHCHESSEEGCSFVLPESYDNTPDISHKSRKWRCLLFSMSITFLNWKVTPPFLKVCLIIMWLNVTEHFPKLVSPALV